MSSDGPRQPEPAGDPRARVRADLEAAAGEALIAALNARENYTAAHSEAVVELALAVGAELELGEVALREIGQVALLHDIGKVGVPDAILQKEGALTAPEWEVMRGHPAIGARIVGAIGSLAHLSPAIRAEHERWDGAGYPDGLAGTEIPLASRICFMCDAWHAMTSDRPYRQALPPEAARDELERHVGSQFCPGAAPALLRVLDRADGAARPAAAATVDTRLPQVRPDRPLEAELRALIAVSRAVAGAHRLEHVLDVVAEQARAVLCASSVSLSRWEPSREAFRALVTVGDLAPAEPHRPADATGPLTGLGTRLVREGRSFAASLDEPELPAGERAELEALGKHSMVAVPIVVEERMWGRLDAFAGAGEAPLGRDHLRFVEALCGQVAAAVGRAELFSQLERLAYEDPLTGLPNRRALDVRLEQAVAESADGERDRALLFCDLDGLKLINDRDGHDAVATRAASRAWTRSTGARPTSSAPPMRRSTRPSASAPGACTSPSRASRRRPSPGPRAGRAGASAMPVRTSARRSPCSCSPGSTATWRRRGRRSGSSTWRPRSPTPTTSRAGPSHVPRRAVSRSGRWPPRSAATASMPTRPTSGSRARASSPPPTGGRSRCGRWPRAAASCSAPRATRRPRASGCSCAAGASRR